jgi:acetyl esterase/lipase
MRWAGETPLPKPTVLPQGQDISIPSRDSGRSIPCRLFKPSSGQSKGTIMHIHGGGWVLMDQSTSDPLLNYYAESSHCSVISVGYRLAPEHPYPAGPEDCFDVADYLVKNGEKEYGGPLRFMGGEVCVFPFFSVLFLSFHCTDGKDAIHKLRDFYEGQAQLSSPTAYITCY